MKKYLFSLLLGTTLSVCHNLPIMAISPDYEANVMDAKKNVEKSPLPIETKKEMNLLLDIFLKNLKDAQNLGREINVIEEQNNTLHERNTRLEKEDPTVFQKILEIGDTGQFLEELIFHIIKTAGKQDLKASLMSHKLIKLIKTLRSLNIDDNNPLPTTIKQQREKVLQILEEKLKGSEENINIVEQAQKAFEEMQKQLAESDKVISEKMVHIAQASRLFMGFINHINQPAENSAAKA